MLTDLTAEQRETLTVVKEHLDYLQGWKNGVDDPALRRGSAALRLLVVERVLGQAWRLVGEDGEPRIRAVDLRLALDGVPPGRIIFGAAGGGHTGGLTLGPVLVGHYTRDQPGGHDPTAFERDFSLSEFAESISMIGRGRIIKRREVVQHVANKLGGVHLDTMGQRKTDERFAVLEEARKEVQISDKNAVFFELLAIGQAVTEAADVQRLISRI